MKRSFVLLFIGVLMQGLIACGDDKIFEENQAIENNTWKSDDIKTFTFEVEDTISPMLISVNLRTTVDYAYSNLYVFMYSEYPDGSSHKDTLEFLLAEPDGKWLGENTGTIVEFKGPIAAGGRFSKQGKYTFKLQHAMREEELKEVVDIGLCIEKFEVDPEETE